MASDDPGWCRKNIVDREGKMQINVTHDHYRGRKEYATMIKLFFICLLDRETSISMIIHVAFRAQPLTLLSSASPTTGSSPTASLGPRPRSCGKRFVFHLTLDLASFFFLKKHIFFKDSGYNFIVRDHPGKV